MSYSLRVVVSGGKELGLCMEAKEIFFFPFLPPFLPSFLPFFYGCSHGIWKFPSQGSNPSGSCDLCLSCGHTGCFNPLCWAKDWTCTSSVTWATAVGFLTHCITVGTVGDFISNFFVVVLQFFEENKVINANLGKWIYHGVLYFSCTHCFKDIWTYKFFDILPIKRWSLMESLSCLSS